MVPSPDPLSDPAREVFAAPGTSGLGGTPPAPPSVQMVTGTPPQSPAALPAATSIPAPGPATQPASVDDPELAVLLGMEQEIESCVQAANLQLGLKVLASNAQGSGEKGNLVHQAIWTIRWSPEALPGLPVETLLAFESALTAHQVYVAGLENYWASRCELLGSVISQIKETRRDGASGDRVKQKEYQVLSSPAILPVYKQFLYARAMAQLLDGLGERFAQMEDGLKRTIDHALAARGHHRKQANFQ